MRKTTPIISIFKPFCAALLAVLCVLPAPDAVFVDFNTAAKDKITTDGELQAKADALLGFFDQMPPVPVYLKNEPVNKSGTNTERGVAYTHCEAHINPAIFIKQGFYESANEKQLTNILKHELTHAFLCRQNMMSGHDANFRRKFAEVGGFGN